MFFSVFPTCNTIIIHVLVFWRIANYKIVSNITTWWYSSSVVLQFDSIVHYVKKHKFTLRNIFKNFMIVRLNNHFFRRTKRKEGSCICQKTCFSHDLCHQFFMLYWSGLHTVTTHMYSCVHIWRLKRASAKDMKVISIHWISVIKENLLRMKLRELQD